MTSLRVAFAGTPEFARAALERIHAAGHVVPLVLTQPDRPAGRGMKLQASPVKQLAIELGVQVVQPMSLRLDGKYPADATAAQAALLAAQPDVMVVAAYGLILPAWVLDLPRLGCLNIHASLLPRWRGAAPIHRAIEAGDERTGITLMQMDQGLDTGAMLLATTESIAPTDTTASLHDRLSEQGAALVLQALDAAAAGTLQPVAQPLDGVTYAHKIDKREAPIDWSLPAAVIERRVRAFDPFPGATFSLGGDTLKLWSAQVIDVPPGQGHAPGEVISTDGGVLIIACGQGALALTQVQRAGGKRQSGREYLQARPVTVGERVG